MTFELTRAALTLRPGHKQQPVLRTSHSGFKESIRLGEPAQFDGAMAGPNQNFCAYGKQLVRGCAPAAPARPYPLYSFFIQ
jgi:hypothetical protein